MPQFKLIKKKFSKTYQEWQWTYSCLFDFTLNRRKITKITITDHFQQKKGREKVTKELILDILRTELNNQIVKPSQYTGKKIVYVQERIDYQDKKYKIVFWFENNDPHWIWIRNCHEQD